MEDQEQRSDGPAIEVDGLECGYGGEAVLRDVSFRVRRGEIFFVIGGSGCGKSTLLRHLVGLHAPVRGTVRFLGRSFTDADPAARREMLRTFGILYQGGALWSSLTLRQNVELPLEEYTTLTRREIEEVATLKLAQVGLLGFEDYFPAEVSGGMRKRAGLDPVTSRRLDDLIRHVRDTFGTTIVVVSHELASIFDLADRAIMLDRAERGIIAEGAPRALLEAGGDPRVREFLTRGEK